MGVNVKKIVSDVVKGFINEDGTQLNIPYTNPRRPEDGDVEYNPEIVDTPEFKKNLVNDLRNPNMPNIEDWELTKDEKAHDTYQSGDVGPEGKDWDIEYIFDFNYKYEQYNIPIKMAVAGKIGYDWKEGTSYNPNDVDPPIPGEPEINDMNVKISAYTNDRFQLDIDLDWANNNPRIVDDLAKNIVAPALGYE